MSWFENAVIYQIYPRSFQDSNNDGIGDIPGIISRLDYIKSLGVDAIWLSPIYKSPMRDFGYDVQDYTDIDPIFGTMDDLRQLVSKAHGLGIKVMMDMVLNHSSDLHQWFQKSRLREGKYTDFYIWRDKIPNNWMACFGGKAWTYDEKRGQYYLHSFLKEQPDLNWHDEECRKAIFNEVRFYLDMGVDGFRLDVINAIGKDPDLRSNPFMFGTTPRPYDMQNHIYDRNTEYTHEYIRQLRSVIDEYDERVMVGEIMIQGTGQMEQSASYMGKDNDELQLCFEFSLMVQRLNAKNMRNVAEKWYDLCSLDKRRIPCWVLSNHDNARAITRAGNDEELARLHAMYLILQRGVSVLYYGEEIGMKSKTFPKKEIQDPLGKRYWPIHKGRDGERRPMQWDESENMGFSPAKPWLACNYSDDWREITVSIQKDDAGSMLSLYKALIDLKKKRSEIALSDAVFSHKVPDGVLAYSFSHDGHVTAVILNMSRSSTTVRVGDVVSDAKGLKVAIRSMNQKKVAIRKDGDADVIELPKYFGVVLTN